MVYAVASGASLPCEPLLFDRAQDRQQPLAQPSHHRQRGELDQAYDEVDRAVEQRARAALAARLVEHPEEDDAHLVQPEQPRQIGGEVLWYRRFRIDGRGAEKIDAGVAHRARLFPKRRERMLRIDADAYQRDHQPAMLFEL